MKVRNGFVSNSSSSSFICRMCGTDESGYDLGLEEIGWMECEDGHVLCGSCLPEDYKEHIIEDDYDGNVLSANACPICTLKEIPKDILCDYLLWTGATTPQEVEKVIRKSFNSLSDFRRVLSNSADRS